MNVLKEIIQELASLYDIQLNDGEGCRIVNGDSVRPATREDMEVILGLDLQYFPDERTNWKSECKRVIFPTQRKAYWNVSQANTNFKDNSEGLEGAA